MKKILLVDDEIDLLRIIKKMVDDDVVFDRACNGREGLDLFHQNKYDLIITDYEMPVLNGLEMIMGIRKTDYSIPIILVSGKGALILNNISVIEKSADLKKLKKTISDLLGPEMIR
ncbi:MAG: response regulator [bacterium]|nr:response regulator [bacterium]